MSETLVDPDQLSDEEVRRLLIQRMARRPNLAGSGNTLLPSLIGVTGQAVQGGIEGLAAALKPNPATYNIPGAGLAVNTYRAVGGITDLATRPWDSTFLSTPGYQLPGYQRANTAWDTQLADARKELPQIVDEPTTPAQRAFRTGMQEFGGMGVPLPAGMLTKAGKVAAAFLSPNSIGPGVSAVNAGLSVAAPAVINNMIGEDQGVLGNAAADQINTNSTDLPTPPIPPISNDQTNALPTVPQFTTPTGEAPPLTPETSNVTTGLATLAAIGIGAALTRGRWAYQASVAAMQGERNAARQMRLFEDASQKFTARANSVDAPPGQNAPLPGNAGSFTTRVQNQTLNENAVINEYIREVTRNQTTPGGHNLSDELTSRLGTTNIDMSRAERTRQFAETGFHEPTGMRVTSYARDVEAPTVRLRPDQRELLDQARYFADELDNRRNIFTSTRQPGRVGFTHIDDVDMRAVVTRARSDPEIRAILDASRRHHDDMIDIATQSGYFTAQEARNLKVKHPGFLASYDATTGRITNPFASRDLNPGAGPQSRDVPWHELDRQHIEAFMTEIERNTVRRDIIESALRYQRANPNTAKVFQVVPEKNELTIPYRDRMGNPFHVVVHDPHIRNSLQREPIGVGNILAAANNIYKSATTGNIRTVTSLAMLNPEGVFAPTSAIRTGYALGTNTIEGAYRGSLDKLLRGKLGAPDLGIADPTAFLDTINHAIRGSLAEGAANIASLMAKDTTRWSGIQLRKLLPPQMADAIHMRMQIAWETSVRHEMKQLGLVHGSGMGSNATPEARFNNIGRTNLERFSQLNTMVPELSAAHHWLARPGYVRLKSFLDEMSGAISESGNAAFFALNKNNPKMSKARLGYETLQLAGHPGTAGSSKFIRQTNAINAYQNVGLQGMARLGRQFNNNPIRAAISHTTMLGALAAGQWFYAMVTGPEAVQKLVDEQNARGFSDGPKFGHHAMSLPHEVRSFWAILNASMADAFGFTTLRPGDTPPKETIDYLWRFFSHHITDHEGRAALAGASETLPQIDAPGINAVTALTGRTPSLNLSSTVEAYQTGDPSKLSRPTGSARSYPGMVSGSESITGGEGGRIIEAVIENLLGVTGAQFIDMYKIADARAGKGDSIIDIAQAMRMEHQLSSRDNTKFPMSLLFTEQRMQRAVKDIPLVRNVDMTLNNMKVAGSFRSDERNAGLTSRRGFALPQATPDQQKLPSDPAIRDIYIRAGVLFNQLNRETGPRARINDLLKLNQDQVRQGIVAGPRRLNHNQIMDVVKLHYRDMAEQLAVFNAEVSLQHGIKFNVRDVDWKKGLDQFPRR